MTAPSVALNVSIATLAAAASPPSSPSLAATALRPSSRRTGKIKTSPAMARKLIWKEASPRMYGEMPTMMAAASVRATMVLRCRPRASASRKTVAMMAPRTTGGVRPVMTV